MKKLKRIRSAFTLAEVLITLGIIGIVAAMTMPTLNDRITKRQVEARVKVAYSTIAQVMKMSENDGNTSGAVANTPTSLKSWFNRNLGNHLQVTELCANQAGCWHKKGVVKTLQHSAPYWDNDIGIGTNTVTFKTAKGIWGNLNATHGQMSINIFGVEIDKNSSTMEFYLDVNGDRGQNIIGKDIYILIYNDKFGTVPAGYSKTKEEVEQNCLTGNGYWCLSKLMRDSWKIDDRVWKR